jgi:hypothetical protein
VELVADEARPVFSEHAGSAEPRDAIAEMQLAAVIGRRHREEARHGMGGAVGVLKRLPEDHVAAALSVDGACPGEVAQPVQETGGDGDPARMEFGIAPRQPADVAILRWAFVGEG